MVRLATLYEYVNRYLKQKSTEEFRANHYRKIKAFIYMNICNKRDAEPTIYNICEDFFFEYEKNGIKNDEFIPEFRDLVIGCLGSMKAHFGNTEVCNFDQTYKDLMHNQNASLDKEYAKLDSKYKKAVTSENAYYNQRVEEKDILTN